MERPNDTWLRIIGIPLAVLPFVLFYMNEYGYDARLFAITFAWGVVSTTTAWYMLFWWVMWVRSRYTRKSQTNRRILMTFGGYSLFTLILQPLETWGISQIDLTGLMTEPAFPRVYLLHIAMALSFVIIVGSYYEITYYLHLYRVAIAEAEAIQKANLQSQFDSLKNQVNPHFLFNSLNSLSALIWEDRAQASLFLDELATVYRYLLQTKQQQLVPLRSEVNFAQSFLYLLKTRYGSALDWHLGIDDALLDRWVPPLTMQTLVENAIRHNVIEVEHPLQIRIRTDGDYLLFTNTIRRKTRRLITESVGLSQLSAQYESMDLPMPRITDDGETFSVRLSLVMKNIGSSVPLI